jgi:hypothetical protein
MVKMYVNIINYTINAQNAKDVLSANTINEKQPVSPVLPPADVSTAKQYPLSDPVGIPTAFVATVYYTQT